MVACGKCKCGLTSARLVSELSCQFGIHFKRVGFELPSLLGFWMGPSNAKCWISHCLQSVLVTRLTSRKVTDLRTAITGA